MADKIIPPALKIWLAFLFIFLLLGYGVAMTVFAAPVLEYTQLAARQLLAPGDYVREVRAATPAVREP